MTQSGGGDGARAGARKRPSIRSAKLLGAILVALLLLGTGIAFAAQGDGEASGGDPAASAPTADETGVELPAKRTATSQTFALPDGSRETRIYEAPVNYKTANGTWQPIDEGLQPGEGASIENGAASFDAHLPARIGQGAVQVSLGDQWVSQKLLGRETETAELTHGTATYSAEGNGTEFEFSSLANGLKEDIVLADPSAPSKLRFALDASAGLTPSKAEDGSIEFRDADAKTRFALPAPVVSDSSPAAAPSDAVHYELEPSAQGGWILSVEVDPGWLAAPDRVWPVRIDPTTVTVTAHDSCLLYNLGAENLNYCAGSGWPQMAAGSWTHTSGEPQLGRTALNVYIWELPTRSDIIEATLHLYSPAAVKNSSGAQVRQITSAWNEKTASWHYAYCAPTCVPWAHPGGDFSERGSEVLTAERGTGAGWWEFKGLGSLVRDWVTYNQMAAGLMVKLKDEGEGSCVGSVCTERLIEWYSAASLYTEKRPYLSVDYFPQAPTDSKITAPIEGAHSAKRFKLASAWTHAGVTGVKFQYQGPEGSWLDIPASKVKKGSGEALASWPLEVKAGAFKSEPLYWDASELGGPRVKNHIRAVLVGSPSADGWVPPVAVELNRDLGNPKDAVAGIGPGTVDLMTGNFTIARSDVSIPGFNSALEFARSLSSRDAKAEEKGVLGPGWVPTSPVEEAGGAAWSSVKEVVESETFEGITETYEYAQLTGVEGEQIPFEIDAAKNFVTPPEATGYVLTRLNSTEIAFTDPAGNRTVFSNGGSGREYLPTSVAMTGGAGNNTRMIYKLLEGKRRLEKMIAPTAPGLSCPDASATTTTGCKVLEFKYEPATHWGGEASMGERLASITFYAPGNGGSWQIANYEYDNKGRLIAEWDPRIPGPLKETYSYETGGQIKTLTPPGLKPWEMQYGTVAGEAADGRLIAVKRASLLAEPATAQTTIAYGVPLSGEGVPNMSPAKVAEWGQADVPLDATAIFPPDQVPSSPPTSYSHATIYYMDSDGFNVNTSTPSGAGTEAASISTTETDEYGNVVRELSPANRLLALGEENETKRKARAAQLETWRVYGAQGTQMEEEEGPLHQVRIAETGELKPARAYTVVHYDQTGGEESLPSPDPHLPTEQTTGAKLGGSLLDQRTTQTKYKWSLRKPTKTIVDPGTGHLNITSVTAYNEIGQPIEQRQPSNPEGGKAGTTRTFYYSSNGEGEDLCKNKPQYQGLPCLIRPAAQPGTSGQPEITVTKFAAYNALGQPMETVQAPGMAALKAGTPLRKTLIIYDSAGRQLSQKTEGGGTAVPKSETLYNTSTGAPETQQFKCETSCEGFDTQATTTVYDALGRPIEYKDADANVAKTTYDIDGRPVTTNDGKGTQTATYDATSGLLTKLEDSAAGTFTATYDADGNLVERGLPDGLTAKTTYNEVDQPIHLTYAKATSCGASCTWLDEGLERSISGQILTNSNTLSKQIYSYDQAGRLTNVNDTPTGGTCVTRAYVYDADSNRKSLTTRSPGIGGICSSSGGTTQTYEYDKADRLEGPTYDSFGRITSLPAVYAGGASALTTGYFSNDMVAEQTQGSVTNSFQLDATGRQRQRLQAGGLEGVEVFHYASGSDSPAWTERGSAWTRSIAGIGGELIAIQDSSKGTTLQLTNVHGDVVATADPNPATTKLLATFRFDEFGNPEEGSAGRYGWLGGKQRRTELPSGVIQMGGRSYVPALGRFLTPDPIPGGSANPYDYANQDPVNAFDLEGTCSTKKRCAMARREGKEKVRARMAHIRATMRNDRAARTSRDRGAGDPFGEVPVFRPWELLAEKALHKVEGIVSQVFGKSCGQAAERFAYGGGTAAGVGVLLQGGGPASGAVGGMLINLGAVAGITAGILYTGSKLGVC